MTYHESLWVAAAAAAPVIALASVVSFTEAHSRQVILVRERMGGRAATPHRRPDPAISAKPTTNLITALDLVSGANMFLQVLVLNAALMSLALNHDNAPLRLPIWGEPGGLALVIIGGYLSANLRARAPKPSGTDDDQG